MPIIEMHMLEGRTTQQKRDVARAVTEAVSTTLNCKPETVRILITEHQNDDGFFVGGLTQAERNQQAASPAEEPATADASR
ncbi:MAG: 4-oxalocrotonate tautomerase family protein [Xanthobacter sp.]